MIEANLSNYHQLENDEVELRKSKMNKIFGPNFLIYLLKNEPQSYSKAMSCPETSYQKKIINNKIEFIMNNHSWETIGSFSSWK